MPWNHAEAHFLGSRLHPRRRPSAIAAPRSLSLRMVWRSAPELHELKDILGTREQVLAVIRLQEAVRSWTRRHLLLKSKSDIKETRVHSLQDEKLLSEGSLYLQEREEHPTPDDRTGAATRIQRIARGRRVRRGWNNHHTHAHEGWDGDSDELGAVVHVQAVARGMRVRRRALQRAALPASVSQAIALDGVHQPRATDAAYSVPVGNDEGYVWSEGAAAGRLQAFVRGWRVRRNARQQAASSEGVTNNFSAEGVQEQTGTDVTNHVRSGNDLGYGWSESAAARRLQAVVRGWRSLGSETGNPYQPGRAVHPETDCETDAATRMQAVARGRRVRRQHSRDRERSNEYAHAHEGWDGDSDELGAVVHVQAVARGMRVRRRALQRAALPESVSQAIRLDGVHQPRATDAAYSVPVGNDEGYVWSEGAAAGRLQAFVRGWRVRRNARQQAASSEGVTNNFSAEGVQEQTGTDVTNHVRSGNDLGYGWSESAAARRLQAVMRGWRSLGSETGNPYQPGRAVHPETDCETDAATRMQAVARGRRVRRQHSRDRGRSNEYAHAHEGWDGDSDELGAVVHVQAVARGMRVRRRALQRAALPESVSQAIRLDGVHQPRATDAAYSVPVGNDEGYVWSEGAAAGRLQAFVRGWRVRRNARQQAASSEGVTNNFSAEGVQEQTGTDVTNHVRSGNDLAYGWSESAAARRLQTVMRGWRSLGSETGNPYQPGRAVHPETDCETDAATRMQAVARGRRVRRQHSRDRGRSNEYAHAHEGRDGDSDELRAAVHVQAVARGMRVRRRAPQRAALPESVSQAIALDGVHQPRATDAAYSVPVGNDEGYAWSEGAAAGRLQASVRRWSSSESVTDTFTVEGMQQQTATDATNHVPFALIRSLRAAFPQAGLRLCRQTLLECAGDVAAASERLRSLTQLSSSSGLDHGNLPPVNNHPLRSLGCRVCTKAGDFGATRYVGPIDGREGIWIGIELDLPNGINDGSANGIRYFSCPERHGLFTREANLTLCENENPVHAVAAPSHRASIQLDHRSHSEVEDAPIRDLYRNGVRLFVSSLGGSLLQKSQSRRAACLLEQKRVAHSVIDLTQTPELGHQLLKLEHARAPSMDGSNICTDKAICVDSVLCDVPSLSSSSKAAVVLGLPRIQIGDSLLTFEEMQRLEDRGELDTLIMTAAPGLSKET